MPLSEEVASGDVRRSLTALRDHLAQALENCRRADAVAPIARQLADVIERLEKLPDENRESAVDDLTKRRSARRAAAAGS